MHIFLSPHIFGRLFGGGKGGGRFSRSQHLFLRRPHSPFSCRFFCAVAPAYLACCREKGRRTAENNLWCRNTQIIPFATNEWIHASELINAFFHIIMRQKTCHYSINLANSSPLPKKPRWKQWKSPERDNVFPFPFPRSIFFFHVSPPFYPSCKRNSRANKQRIKPPHLLFPFLPFLVSILLLSAFFRFCGFVVSLTDCLCLLLYSLFRNPSSLFLFPHKPQKIFSCLPSHMCCGGGKERGLLPLSLISRSRAVFPFFFPRNYEGKQSEWLLLFFPERGGLLRERLTGPRKWSLFFSFVVLLSPKKYDEK